MAFQIGEWEVRPESDDLVTDGREVRVTPLDMDVLVHLAERAGEVVGANELLDACWRSSVAADNAVYKSVARLRKALGDTSRNPTYIKTIPKRGYSLIAEVHGCASQAAETTGGTPKSIAIFPFKNIDGNPENQYLVDGIAEALLDGLGKLPDLRVASRADSLMHCPEQETTAEIGSCLHVDHLLEGSVQRSGSRLRVTVQLISVRDGSHLYSEQFSGDLEDVFRIQDEIATAVVNALSIHLDEGSRTEMLNWGTTNVHAYLLTMDAKYRWLRRTVSGYREAIELYKAALEADPSFIRVCAESAQCVEDLAKLVSFDEAEKLGDFLAQMLEHATAVQAQHPNKVFMYDDRDVVTRISVGLARLTRYDLTSEERANRQQILLPPPAGSNYPDECYLRYGRLLNSARLYEEAIAYIERFRELQPDATIWGNQIVPAYIGLGRLTEALDIRRRHLVQWPENPQALTVMAGYLAKLGEWRLAQEHLKLATKYDSEGRLSFMGRGFMDVLRGLHPRGSAALESLLADKRGSNEWRGRICFALGDWRRGIEYWRRLSERAKENFYHHLDESEFFFADREGVLRSAEYQALLTDLGIGKDWQRYVAERVMELARVTGIELSDNAASAYRDNVFLMGASLRVG